jgi:hypothetical protein
VIQLKQEVSEIYRFRHCSYGSVLCCMMSYEKRRKLQQCLYLSDMICIEERVDVITMFCASIGGTN